MIFQKIPKVDIQKKVANMIRKKCKRHPHASKHLNGPKLFDNRNYYDVRFKTERNKLLKDCKCSDPVPPRTPNH